MRKSFLKAFGYFACMAWSGVACAVGFGGINVTSSLGRPLSAEIELVSVDQAEKASLSARLASPDAFKGAGIDYPYALPKLKFAVQTRANGEPYIKATSDQPVNEPFVSLLIELSWSSGRLLREYTFLLDPPGFVAEQPAVAEVKAIEPVVVAAASAPAATSPQAEPELQAASAVAETPASTEAASAVEAAKPAEPAAIAALPPAEAPAPVKSAHASITVKQGDTLSKIASQTKSADVSLERMLVALYRANAEAFDGSNMNRLRTGKILRLPQAEELGKLQQAEADKEVRAQVADWNAYRQKLASATAPAAEQRAKQEVAGKISTSIIDKAPSKEAAKEVLKLSKGDEAGDKAAAGGKSAKDNAKEEEAVAKAKALKEAEERTALLEKNIKDMQRLAELKSQAAAKAGEGAATSAPASAVPLVASAVASAVAPASAVAAVKPKPKVIAPEPSLLDEILGNPIYLGAGAAVLLGLGVLGFKRTRKQDGKKGPPATEEVGSATGRIAAPVMPSPETGDFTGHVAPADVDADEVDPIAEADMFMNFGRDGQAEEVLKDALHRDPSNNRVKLKLLSIYANRKDTKSFYVYALEIKESGDAAAWEQAAAMGLALEPNNALYGGSGAVAVPEAPVAEAEAALPIVDFDLSFGGTDAAKSAAFEPDMSVGEKTSVMSVADLLAAQEAPMDFDVTSTHGGGIKAIASGEPKLDVSSMDFDVTGTHPGIKGGIQEEPKLEIPALDFDVTGVKAGQKAFVAEVSTEQAPALNLDDLVFEVPAKPVSAPAESVPEADQGMAFTIDIPEARTEAAKPVQSAKDVGLAEISLNLDDVAAPAPAAGDVKDERWQEVATKLDLAKAYQEMGDQAGAREILEEVMRDGDEKQRAAAEVLLQQLV